MQAGSGQRHERESTARAILDAARSLFVEEGYQNVSIRKIADRIGYSPAAIYSYFESKDEIFLALAEEGFHMLLASGSCTRDTTFEAGPIDCIRAVFLNVYEFSKQHPEYHALMFLDRSVPRISRDWERFGFVRDMQLQLTALIQHAIDRGDFPADREPALIFKVLLAAVHGVSAMRLCDRLGADDDADALARATIEAALNGLRAGPAEA
jgi:AcrR family transcriptional regulator